MYYNVRTVEYEDSMQVRLYSKPVTVSKKIPELSKKTKRKYSSGKRTNAQIQHSLESSINRTVNKIYSIARSNKWDYFVTLTIDPSKLDNMDYVLIMDKLNIWTNNLRKRYALDLKYIFVPELHKDKKKWHFHGLFSNIGSIPLEFSGKVCVGKFVYDYVKKPYATKIYNLPLWKYGFSTCTEIRHTDKASSYITKYLTKDLTQVLVNQHRFVASHNVMKPIERVYCIDCDNLDKIEEMLKQNIGNLSYMSNVSVNLANYKVSYLEFNK